MPPLDRRDILKWIAGGAALSVGACSRPDEQIFPATNQPEGVQPGEVQRFATALPLAGYLRGVTGLVVDGRPIKLEGLAGHPASLGATDLFTETAILDLYDPQRLRAPGGPMGPSSWPAAAKAMWERIAPRRGEGTVLLTGRVTSPTLLARIAALKAQFPGVRHVRWEPFDDDHVLAGTQAAFGRRLTPRPRLAEADVVLCLGADPLGPGPEQVANARAWAQRRRTGALPKLYVIEPSLTQTGAMADARVAVGPREMTLACKGLATLVQGQATVAKLSPDAANRTAFDLPLMSMPLANLLSRAAADLFAVKGRAMVLVGGGQSAEAHAFAAGMNAQLAAPLDYIAPVDPDPTPHGIGMAALGRDMAAGHVDSLIVLDANPAYAVPGFAEAMKRVPLTISASVFPNETGDAAQWTLPLGHPLESWHDGRAPDGTASIAQPLVRAFHDTRTPVEIVDLLIDPAAGSTAYQRHREQWASLGEAGWRQALVEGVIPDTAAKAEPVGSSKSLVSPSIGGDPHPSAELRSSPSLSHWEREGARPAQPGGKGEGDAGPFTIEVRPSPTLWDGRFANNAWAQECPDPITKEVWGAAARMHPADMAAHGLSQGDTIRLGGGTWAVAGLASQARGVVTLLAGHGRSNSGAVADGIGANAFLAHGPLARGEGKGAILTTQHQFAIAGELAKLFPVLAPGAAMPRVPDRASLLPNGPVKDAPPQWAMAIDTDVCIGCNACVVACQAENNVPPIGPHEIAVGRDMHWLRVDRYEDADGTTRGFQPVPCMQCEKAPCEPVCPVEASVHDAQGLNVQVYNRCIGTRTCEANCPYKVRRFNFRDYAGASLWGDAEDASVTAQRNPDVSVRARGVMEKCTYCVQRIERATRASDAGDATGPVVTACQAACPTSAITFGTLGSEPIIGKRADPRHYALLEELGTKPRTTYLARRRHGGEA